MADVVEDMIHTWAPDDLWQVAQPSIPVATKRHQGGGRRRAQDRAVLAAIPYLVQAGCSWRKLPAAFFGVSRPTVHRRFTEWSRHGLWEQITTSCCTGCTWPVESTGPGRSSTPSVSGPRKEDLTGPNPVDRGKPGSKIHVLCDRRGIPLQVLISAANTPDAQLLFSLLDSLTPVRGRRGRPRRRPGKLHADKAFDHKVTPDPVAAASADRVVLPVDGRVERSMPRSAPAQIADVTLSLEAQP